MEHHDIDLEKMVPRTYVQQGLQNIKSHQNKVRDLLKKQKIPSTGWDDQNIELMIHEFSMMDSNNFSSNAGVGEREGRVFSSLVAKRHFYLAHGIGRSGDIVEVQPKAAGSSIIYKLTNKMASHALHLSGLNKSVSCIVFPLATGMSLSLCMRTLQLQASCEKRYVIWPRIDQKSCFKSILAAGLIPIVVENSFVDGQLVTNVNEIENILKLRSHEILCVLSTTSCFAPRQPDKVDEVAELCASYDVGHIINNAYGLQCDVICKLINRAILKGRVDAFIQSTDKNFMVPVGGAVVASSSIEFLQRLSATYPGRASMTPIIDLFITFLSMGEEGYLRLLSERQRLLTVLADRLQSICAKYNLSRIVAPRNTISFAVSLESIVAEGQSLSFLGSMLFQRNVSGCRVVQRSSTSSIISNYSFQNWGSHHTDYPASYITAACAIGMEESDIDCFIERLDKVLQKFIKSKGGLRKGGDGEL